MGMYAQEEEVIDHKGTRIKVRNTVVTSSATAPSEPLQNDIWFDTSAEVTKIYDGTSWLTINLDALNKKEDNANKSTDITLSDATNTKFPTELAVKTYIDNELAASNGTNIYTDDGSLTGNRAITQSNFDLNFDANTLVISGNDNRVGIGTDAPTQEMDVNGRMNITNGVIQKGGTAITTTSDLGLYSSNSGDPIRIGTNNAPVNFYSDLDGLGSTGSTANMSINTNGNVSIGVTTATAKLDVNGTTRIRTLGTGANTDQVVTADTNGNLRKSPITSLETKTTISQNTTTGVITHNSEDSTTQLANVVSTNSNNSISVGTDGGAYYNNPIKAYGTLIPASNTYTAIGISSATKTGVGRFTFNMATTRSTANYPIQLSVLESGTSNINIYVTAQTTTSFSIAIIEEIGGTFPSDNYVDRTCYFTIMDF
ncbi:hypothetical protein [Maribacter sp. LLG6340-A2]|uniref:hypothetical protein n=1 Tax=Maribacter sp. LLG6340-A2 TaxID=3160834 RepID=UPI00386BECE7